MQTLYEPRSRCALPFFEAREAFETLTNHLEELAKIYKNLDRGEIQSLSRDYSSLSAHELLSLLTACQSNYLSLFRSYQAGIENLARQVDDLLLVSMREVDLNHFLDQLQKTIHSFNYCSRLLEMYSREGAELRALKAAYLKSFLQEKNLTAVDAVSERLHTLEQAREKSISQPNLLQRLKYLFLRRSKHEDSRAVYELETEIRELERFLELAQTRVDDSADFFKHLLKQNLQVLASRMFTQLVDALDREASSIDVATKEEIFLTREKKEELVQIYLNHCIKPNLEDLITQQSNSAEESLEAIDQTLEEYKKYLLGEIENLEESEKLQEIKLSLHSKYCELPDRKQFWGYAQRYLKILDQNSKLKVGNLIFFVTNLKKLAESLPPELREVRMEMRLYDLEQGLLSEIGPNLPLTQHFDPLIWRAVKTLVSKEREGFESESFCESLETWLIDQLLADFQKSQQGTKLRLPGEVSQEFRILGSIKGLGRKDSILPILLISIGANSSDLRRTAAQIFCEMWQRQDSRCFLKQVFEEYKVAGFSELKCFLEELADKANETDFYDCLVDKLYAVCEELLSVLLNERSFYRFMSLKGLSMSQKTQRFNNVLASLSRGGDSLALEALVNRALGLFVDSRAGVDGFALEEVFKLLDEEVSTEPILTILAKHATVKPQEVRLILQRNSAAAERCLLKLLENEKEEVYPLTQFIVSPSITAKLLELAQKGQSRAAEALLRYHLSSLSESLVGAYLAQRFDNLGSSILEELNFNLRDALQDSRTFLLGVMKVVSRGVNLQLTEDHINLAIDFVLELEHSGQTILALTYVSLVFDAILQNSQEFEPQQIIDELAGTHNRKRKKLNLRPLIDPRSLNITRQLNSINPVAARAFLHHVTYFQGNLDDLLKDYENLIEEENKAGLTRNKTDSSRSLDDFFEDLILTVLTEDLEKFKGLRQSIFGSKLPNIQNPEASLSEQCIIAWQLSKDEVVRSWFNLTLERFLNQGLSEQEAKVEARREIIRQGQVDMLYHGTSFSRANQILEGLGLRALSEKGLPGAFVTDSLQLASQFAHWASREDLHLKASYQPQPAILYVRSSRLKGQEIEMEPVGVLNEPFVARFRAGSSNEHNEVSRLCRVPIRFVSCISYQPGEDFKFYEVYPGLTPLDSVAWLWPDAELAKKVARKEKLRREFRVIMDDLKKWFIEALANKRPHFQQELEQIYNHLTAQNSSYTKIIEILDTYVLAALEDLERSRKLCKIYEDFAKQSKHNLAFIHDFLFEYPEIVDLITESDSVDEIVRKLNFYVYDQQRAALESSRTIISKLNRSVYRATGRNELHINSNELHSILVNLGLGGWTDEEIMRHFKSALRKISSGRQAIFKDVAQRALSSLPASIRRPSDDQFTVVLTASVGREESSIESDLDFLIFIESDETYRQFEEFFVFFRRALLQELEKLNFGAPDFGMMHVCHTFVTPQRLQVRISPLTSKQYVEPTVIMDARAVYGSEELVDRVQQALAFKLKEEKEAWLQFLKKQKLKPFRESLRNGLDQLIAGDPPGNYKSQFRRIVPFMVYYLVSANIEKFLGSYGLNLPVTTRERLEKLAELSVLEIGDAKFLHESYDVILQLYTRYSLVEQSSHPKANLYILTLEERERLQFIAEELLRLFDKYVPFES